MRSAKISSVFYGLLLTLFTSFSVASQPVIRLAADEWCPYNCAVDDPARPGYMIEIAKTVFGKAGYQVDYQIMPFQRALQEALKGSIDGVPGIDKATEEEAVTMYQRTSGKSVNFHNSPLIGEVKASFYTTASGSWTFDAANPEASIKALGGKVGIPQGYSYDISPMLKKQGVLVEISGDAPMEQLLKMLESGRIAAVIEDDAVINDVAAGVGMTGKLRYAGEAEEPVEIFIGFGPTRQEYAAILQKGMEEMRASGELARILQKYNLKDWKR